MLTDRSESAPILPSESDATEHTETHALPSLITPTTSGSGIPTKHKNKLYPHVTMHEKALCNVVKDNLNKLTHKARRKILIQISSLGDIQTLCGIYNFSRDLKMDRGTPMKTLDTRKKVKHDTHRNAILGFHRRPDNSIIMPEKKDTVTMFKVNI